MRHASIWAVAFAAAIALPSAFAAPRPLPKPSPLYRDAAAPVEQRVEDLLARMTDGEKLAQLLAIWKGKAALYDEAGRFDPARAAVAFPDGIGQLTRLSDYKGSDEPHSGRWRDARASAALANAVQHWAVEHTRLGIPVLFHEEGLHGYASKDVTVFPQAIALASSWDPDLVHQVNAVTAREAAARGVRLILSPVIDVARDPRWGRIEETFGEDPYLVGEMGVAAIDGLQGDALPLAQGKVFATLKHFTGHGQPESGTNIGPAEISERTLRENFFPPFEQAIKRTKVRVLMPSYNEIDGVPSHRNVWLLQKVLRGEWGYDGAVVSDYAGVEELADLHHTVPDRAAAAIAALRTGVDMNLPDGEAFATLAGSLRAGKVARTEIDDAVRRVLRLKFEAGLFEHPFADVDAADAISGNAEAAALALEAAERSAVLLKNDGLLPLKPGKYRRIAVIGPNGAAVRLGGYAGAPRHAVTMLDGIRARFGNDAEISYAHGVKITDSDDGPGKDVQLADRGENAKLIAEAVDTAEDADLVVLVLGDNDKTCREALPTQFLGDRDELTLPGQQTDLAHAVFETGTPTVVLLINGRPAALGEIAEKANAIVEGWYLGQEGGTAAAAILAGDVNPGGKLPVTFPRSVGQLPMFYNMKPSARRGYSFASTAPLYPFGWGLSYTRFEIGEPKLSVATIKPDESVRVSVAVTNIGDRVGDEVVQLYIHQRVSSVTRPIKELKGFSRVTLKPGETRTVTFEITQETLRFWNIDMKRVVEPGIFDIMVGPNSVDLKQTVLTVEE